MFANNREICNLSRSQIRKIMEATVMAVLATPPVSRKRPIAASAVDLSTGEIILTTTNAFPSKSNKSHAEEKIFDSIAPGPNEIALFITREPCVLRKTNGRFPCAERIINDKRVKAVFILDKDPNPNIKGKGIKHLRDTGIPVIVLNIWSARRKQNREWRIRANIPNSED